MTRVSLVKGDDRKANVRKALDLIESDIDLQGRRPLIKINMVNTAQPTCATHPDAVSALIEFLRDRGEKNIVIAEGPAVGYAARGFRNYGYDKLAEKYGVDLMDLCDADEYKRVFVIHSDLKPHPVNLSGPLTDPDNYVISITRLKTHQQVGATLTVKNVAMGAPRMNDKYRMHPSEGANALLDHNLFSVMTHLHIDLGVLDGFEGMEGDGPVNGETVDHRVALAGADFLAVDRVGCEVMGIDFEEIRYLNYLWDWGFGEAALDKIDVVGETIESVRRVYRMAPRFVRMRNQEKKGTYLGLVPEAGSVTSFLEAAK